jgi:hypothetical protein
VCARRLQVGLRGINGLYLFEIERADGSKIKVVDHDTVLEKGDVLWFAGGRHHASCLVLQRLHFCARHASV